MTRHDKDRSGKWLIQHFGRWILWLAGLPNVVRWRTVAPEVVVPQRLPDGLLEVYLTGQAEPVLILLELVTYPSEEQESDIGRDIALVLAERRQLPEVLTIVFHPHGNARIEGVQQRKSVLGWTEWQARWRVVELWRLAANDLLATNEVGLVPWVPLTQFDRPVEEVLRECRERIDQQASVAQRESLLAVTHVLTNLRFKDPNLLAIFGGGRTMLELPLLLEIEEKGRLEATQKNLLTILEARFGTLPTGLGDLVRAIRDENQLEMLIRHASVCKDLPAFHEQLPSQ
jgi:hypothetical protein